MSWEIITHHCVAFFKAHHLRQVPGPTYLVEMSKKWVFLKKSNFRKLIGGDLFVGGSKLAENLHARRGQHPPGFGGLGGLIMGFYGGFMRGSKFGIGKKIFQSEAKFGCLFGIRFWVALQARVGGLQARFGWRIGWITEWLTDWLTDWTNEWMN